MGQPAARVGDPHVCPMSDGPKPHVGGPILPPGWPTVLIGGMPAARMGDMCTCVGPPDTIAQGEPTVLIGGKPAARMGDMTMHGGKIIVGFPTVLIGKAAGGSGGGGGKSAPAKGAAPAQGAARAAKSPSKPGPFSPDRHAEMVGKGVQGEGSKPLQDAMNMLYENRDDPNNPAVDSALETVAAERGQPLDKIQGDWARYQDLLADQRRIGAANDAGEVPGLKWPHGDFMGSRSQLRSGAATGELLGVDPVFGALLNPTGGLVGPGNVAFDGNDSAVGYHGAIHDAAGYSYNYHDTGPGYDYLGTDNRDTSSPLSGQRNGIGHWRDVLGSDRSTSQRATDAAGEQIMRGTVGAVDGVSAVGESIGNAYDSATDAVGDAWDELF